MAYADLNPVRAAMAATPEETDHTSIQLRIDYWESKAKELKSASSLDNGENLQPKSLMPFAGNSRQPMPPGLAFNLLDYMELLDWTDRQIKKDKRVSIDAAIPPALTRKANRSNSTLLYC